MVCQMRSSQSSFGLPFREYRFGASIQAPIVKCGCQLRRGNLSLLRHFTSLSSFAAYIFFLCGFAFSILRRSNPLSFHLSYKSEWNRVFTPPDESYAAISPLLSLFICTGLTDIRFTRSVSFWKQCLSHRFLIIRLFHHFHIFPELMLFYVLSAKRRYCPH